MATAPPQTDAVLVRRLRERDRTAWEELYDEYGGRLRGFAYRLTGNPHDADDLVQETFVRALPRLDRLDPDTVDLGPYLFTTLRNLFLKSVERGRRAGAGGGGAGARRGGSDRGRSRAEHAPAPPAGGGAGRERAPGSAPAARARAAGARGQELRRDRRHRRPERERGRAADLTRPREPAHRAPARAGRSGTAAGGVPALPAAAEPPPRRAAARAAARRDARAPRRLQRSARTRSTRCARRSGATACSRRGSSRQTSCASGSTSS